MTIFAAVKEACIDTANSGKARPAKRIVYDNIAELNLYKYIDVEILVKEFSTYLYQNFSVCEMYFHLPEFAIEVNLANKRNLPSTYIQNSPGKIHYPLCCHGKSLGELTMLCSTTISDKEKSGIDHAVNQLREPLYNAVRYAHAIRSG